MNLLRWAPWRHARRDEELDEEILAHLRMAEAHRMAGGESPAVAAANARREFGNVDRVQEITREMWGGIWLERLVQDLRFGARMLWRSPGFSIVAILCLTVAIGAVASAFRRPATARRRGASHRGTPDHPARRRTHRKPRFLQRRSGDGSPARSSSQRLDDLHGYP